jgi:hypothetical protein
MRVRDFQRSRVYALDRRVAEMYPSCQLTLEECVELARRMVGAPVVIKDGRGRRRPGATAKHITLPTHSRTRHMVAHECAHVILKRSAGCDEHGPAFVATYVSLLERHLGIPRAALLRALDDLKIKMMQ